MTNLFDFFFPFQRLNFGLTVVTMFVSMWISNTAAVAMMCPIMQAVLEELERVSVVNVYANLLQSTTIPVVCKSMS